MKMHHAEPYPCGIRWADRQDAPLQACTLPEGHLGRHETHPRRATIKSALRRSLHDGHADHAGVGS